MEECTGSQAAGIIGAPTGSGTANTLPIWTGTSTLGNSLISQSTNLITLNGAGASGGALIQVGANNFTVNTTAAGNAYTVSGVQHQWHNGFSDSYLCQGGGADDYIRACGSAGVINIGDVATGGVVLGAASNPTTVVGNLSANGSTTTLGDAVSDALSFIGTVTSHIHYKTRTNTLACGSGASQITGSGDERGGINFSASTTTCQITFVNATNSWANAPFCTATLSSSGDVWVSAVSTSSVTFGLTSKGAGEKLYYHCDGGN